CRGAAAGRRRKRHGHVHPDLLEGQHSVFLHFQRAARAAQGAVWQDAEGKGLTRERLLGWSTLIAAAVIPLIATDYWLYLLTLMAIYGIVALGLNLLTGLSGQISLGHAGFFAVGAYVASVLASKYAVAFPLAAALAVAAGWAIGFLIGIPA